MTIVPGHWGFTNQTDIVTLTNGERVVVQRYRRRDKAEYRLRMMQALQAPLAQLDITIPVIRQLGLDDDPPWATFEPLPGLPVPEALEDSLENPRFPFFARRMGELSARLRRLPTEGIPLNDDWADPANVAAQAVAWVKDIPELNNVQRASLSQIIEAYPILFSHRPLVVAHGDFAPVNVLIDGDSITGLIDFESVRLADPLLDAAWWAWSVGFHGPVVLQRVWRPFLQGAEIDPDEPRLSERIRALQILRLLELIAEPNAIGSDIRLVLLGRLRAMLV
jgi:aminoglycoside phosphotransferase (APT) family kinase protein